MSKQLKESKNDHADEVRAHSFDGIQEYDNPMPGWWKFVFYLTIVWAVGYVAAISYGWIPSYEDDLATGQAEIRNRRMAVAARTPAVVIDEATLIAASKDEASVAAGKKMYGEKCAPCHAAEGQGLIGPNLTDNAWLNGGGPLDIHRVIKDGVTAKGMPAWGPSVGDEGVNQLVGFILTLKGTTPPNPKAAQGTVVP